MKGNFRWVVVFLLFLISMTNYIDRASISFAISKIAQEFHFSSADVGYILGAFGIGYLLTVLVGGLLADKYGSHIVLTCACVLWMFATLCLGFVQGFMIMFLARVFLGVAEGPNFPCVTKTIGDWLPLNERNRAFSMSIVAVPLSLAMSGPVVTYLIDCFNWRGMYFALAGLSLLFIPLWWFLYRDKPAESSHVSKQELAYIQASAKASIAHHGLTGIREILKNKTLLANTWGYFVFGFYLFFFMNWMPEYLSKTFHYKLSKIGLFSTIPWLTAAVMTLIVGWFTDLVYTKTQCLRYSRTYPLIVSHLVSGVALIPLWMSHDIYWILLSLSLSVGAVMSVNAVYYSVNVDVAKERAATSFGVMGLLFSLSGILSPVLTGWIVNFSGQFQSVFILMLILSLSSSLILWLFHNGHAK
jgi:ACS family hexuronate transporter-like MFS transporter